MLKENRSEAGNAMEQGKGQVIEAGSGLTNERGSQIVGQPQAENGQGQPGNDLVAQKPQANDRVDSAHQGSGEAGHEKGQHRLAGQLGGDEGRQGTGNHHALHPQVQNTGFLRQDFAQRGIEDGRAGLNGRGQQRNDQFRIHGFLRRCRPKSLKKLPARTVKRIRPSMMPPNAAGTCSSS